MIAAQIRTAQGKQIQISRHEVLLLKFDLDTVVINANLVTSAMPCSPELFSEGDIIYAPHLVPTYDPNTLMMTTGGFEMRSVKMRPMIIIQKWANHMLAVPLFTLSNDRLQRISSMERKEYIGIKKRGDQSYQNSCVYKPLEAVVKNDWSPNKDAHVLFSAPAVVRYNDLAIVKAKLTEESLKRLLTLC